MEKQKRLCDWIGGGWLLLGFPEWRRVVGFDKHNVVQTTYVLSYANHNPNNNQTTNHHPCCLGHFGSKQQGPTSPWFFFLIYWFRSGLVFVLVLLLLFFGGFWVPVWWLSCWLPLLPFPLASSLADGFFIVKGRHEGHQ